MTAPDLTPPGMTGAEQSEGPKPPNMWLRLTSYGWDKPQVRRDAQDLTRRSRLTSYIIAGLLVVLLVLIPAGIGDPATTAAIAIGLVVVFVAGALNRIGQVSVAGALLVALIIGAVFGVILTAPGGLDTIYLPAFDLLAMAVVIAASVMPPEAVILIGLVNSGLIAADFFLQPHTGDLIKQVDLQGPVAMIVRPIALNIIIAVVAFLWARGVREQIRRADRAEEIAKLEHDIAEQKRQLDVGVQQILQTHIRVANGDYSARAPLDQSNVLWQIASSLNNLVSRLQRSGQAEFQFQRTNQEIQRLRDALLQARSGRQPIWPAPTGTAVDELLEVIVGPSRPLPPPGSGRSGPGGTAPF